MPCIREFLKYGKRNFSKLLFEKSCAACCIFIVNEKFNFHGENQGFKTVHLRQQQGTRKNVYLK